MKIKQLVRLPDVVLDQLFYMSSAEVTNEAILGLLIQGITSDVQALQFCDTMESLVDSMQSRLVIKSLRNGNFIRKSIT